jgi:hypothetical protein
LSRPYLVAITSQDALVRRRRAASAVPRPPCDGRRSRCRHPLAHSCPSGSASQINRGFRNKLIRSARAAPTPRLDKLGPDFFTYTPSGNPRTDTPRSPKHHGNPVSHAQILRRAGGQYPAPPLPEPRASLIAATRPGSCPTMRSAHGCIPAVDLTYLRGTVDHNSPTRLIWTQGIYKMTSAANSGFTGCQVRHGERR